MDVQSDAQHTIGTLLPLPMLGQLSPEQIRGASCLWCPVESAGLNAETAIDFGACHGSLIGQATIWYPRACRACALRVALATHNAHPRTCGQCVDDPSACAERRALRRLSLELRR